MIPRPEIAKWQNHAPWKEFAQVEQDLIITRILIGIFSDGFLRENLAFRGGTALHKLYLKPAPPYSEDIDLVQIRPGPIKPIMQRIGYIIDFFDENRKTSIRGHGAKMYYRYTSEYEQMPMRLKIEINCKEHFSVLDKVHVPLELSSGWFSGTARVKTFSINELLGTKFRALFQRSKGRDLFDIDYARKNHNLNIEELITCYKRYIEFAVQNKRPSRKQFLQNLEAKEKDPEFSGDLEGLLRPGIAYNQEEAFNWVKSDLIRML